MTHYKNISRLLILLVLSKLALNVLLYLDVVSGGVLLNFVPKAMMNYSFSYKGNMLILNEYPFDLTGKAIVVGVFMMLMGGQIVCWGNFVQFLKNCQKGAFFTLESLFFMKRVTQAYFVLALLKIPANTLLGLAVALQQAPGEREISVTVGTGTLEDIFVGFIFVLCGKMLFHGVQLKEEQDLTV